MFRRRLRKLPLWQRWATLANAEAKAFADIYNAPRGRPRKTHTERPGLPERETESVKDAAHRWGISTRMMIRHLDQGVIQRHRIGRRVVVSIAECRAVFLGTAGSTTRDRDS